MDNAVASRRGESRTPDRELQQGIIESRVENKKNETEFYRMRAWYRGETVDGLLPDSPNCMVLVEDPD